MGEQQTDSFKKSQGKIRLVVSDLDGTLLAPDDTISEENQKAIQQLQEQGILFSIATGRPDVMFQIYTNQLGIEIPVIACNGALVLHPGSKEIIYKKTMDEQVAIQIMEFCSKHQLDTLAYTTNIVYHSSCSLKIKRFHKYNQFANNQGLPLINIKLLDDQHQVAAKEGVIKLLVSFQQECDSDKIHGYVDLLDAVEAVSSMENVLDIMPQGTSKGNALKILATYLDIELSHIAVLGDNKNDVSMMQVAGVSFAMGNGDEDARLAATEVIPNEDFTGVSKAITQFEL